MTEIVLALIAFVLVALGGLMSALDAALGVTSRADLADWAVSGRNGPALLRIAGEPAAHANAVVFIRILAESTAAVLVTAALMLALDSLGLSLLFAALSMTAISFVLVGASPRSVGRQHARGLLIAGAPIIRAARVVLGPLAHLLVVVGSRVTPGVRRGTSFASEEQLLSMVDEAASQDLIEADDRDLIHSVFDFTDTLVRTVMVPRTDMVTVPSTATTHEAMALFLERGVSRVPVTDDEADDIVGVVYLKDLVQFSYSEAKGWRDVPVGRVARTAVFVPESMRAETLLQQMKKDAVHVCLVVDEYGGVAGLITLEDLIEELVGDIADEYDRGAAEVVELEPGRYRVSARLGLDEVGDLFDLELHDDDVDSVGGLLGKMLGRVPLPGATVVHHGLLITGGASRGRGRGLATVFVERTDDAPDGAETGDPDARHPRTGEIHTVRQGDQR